MGKWKVSPSSEERESAGERCFVARGQEITAGLGRQWLPEKQGQPQTKRDLPGLEQERAFPEAKRVGKTGRDEARGWVNQHPQVLQGACRSGASLGWKQGSDRAS